MQSLDLLAVYETELNYDGVVLSTLGAFLFRCDITWITLPRQMPY
jgi:hypothetical protein